ncbi:hypothetical protein B0T16DRAFT_460217 [Cercophora newfieldiana]|uniref:Uncharacterized protein n=1 Tax=Cercophora newfieldiana TaxID=92897 RepID=A0AA39Y178_9PEZI|nr:hypothetical protein B0T16DRAFT_460217 [Cercophora newfieldiana]
MLWASFYERHRIASSIGLLPRFSAALVRSFTCLDQCHTVSQELPVQHVWALITSRRSDETFKRIVKSVNIAGPEDLTQSWKVLGVVLAVMPNLESLVLHKSSGAGPNDQEFAFWRWFGGGDHGATDNGGLAPPPDSAPCRSLMPSLRTVVLETQYTNVLQRPTPEHILISLFTRHV